MSDLHRLKIDEIEIGEEPRLRLTDDQEFKNLVQSICEVGLIRPILVAAVKYGDDKDLEGLLGEKTKYKLIDGYRRLKAMQQLERDEVWVEIK